MAGNSQQAGKPLKVLQVSDSHVSADQEADYRGQNADRNLLKLLPSMCDWGPDLVLLTGDVSEDATPAAYSRVSGMLGTLDVPLLALPGNHDDPVVMQDHFRQGPWDGPYALEMGPWLLVLMDSTVKGRISGSVDPEDLNRLDKVLKNSSAYFVLLALHHQPVPVNAPWIDRYALENPDPFLQRAHHDQRIKCITWGHIHHDFRAERNGVKLLGSPSVVANSLPQTPRFSLDPEGPSCRWLELYADGRVETGVLRG